MLTTKSYMDKQCTKLCQSLCILANGTLLNAKGVFVSFDFGGKGREGKGFEE